MRLCRACRRHVLIKLRKGRGPVSVRGQQRIDGIMGHIAQIIRALHRHHHQRQHQPAAILKLVHVQRCKLGGLPVDPHHEFAGRKRTAYPAIRDRRQPVDIGLRHQTILDIQGFGMIDRPPVQCPVHPVGVVEIHQLHDLRHVQQKGPCRPGETGLLANDGHRSVQVVQHHFGHRYPQPATVSAVMAQIPFEEMLDRDRVSARVKAGLELVAVAQIFGIADHHPRQCAAIDVIFCPEQGSIAPRWGRNRPGVHRPHRGPHRVGAFLVQGLQLCNAAKQQLRQFIPGMSGLRRPGQRFTLGAEIKRPDLKGRITQRPDPDLATIAADHVQRGPVERNDKSVLPGSRACTESGLRQIGAAHVGDPLGDQSP